MLVEDRRSPSRVEKFRREVFLPRNSLGSPFRGVPGPAGAEAPRTRHRRAIRAMMQGNSAGQEVNGAL